MTIVIDPLKTSPILLVVVTVLGHLHQWFELEDPDGDPLAVQTAADYAVPNLTWLKPGHRVVGAHPFRR